MQKLAGKQLKFQNILPCVFSYLREPRQLQLFEAKIRRKSKKWKEYDKKCKNVTKNKKNCDEECKHWNDTSKIVEGNGKTLT